MPGKGQSGAKRCISGNKRKRKRVNKVSTSSTSSPDIIESKQTADKNSTHRGNSHKEKNVSHRLFDSTHLYSCNMAYSQPFDLNQAYAQGSPPTNVNTGSVGSIGFQTPFMPGMQPGMQPPPWAVELLMDMKVVKGKISSIDKIEKTVNLIHSKVSDLEVKMKSLDTRVLETEKGCQFIADELESSKKELKSTKDTLGQVKKSCNDLEKSARLLNEQKEKMEEKLLDLETRSMRENLMFYGLPEDESENCEHTVKRLCEEKLQIANAGQMVFNRVHRVGRKHSGKVRPIVVNFHYYQEREKVRRASFDHAEILKQGNIGIGVQLPREVREARKPLYATMKAAKNDGKDARFIGKKLIINGEEYGKGSSNPQVSMDYK